LKFCHVVSFIISVVLRGEMSPYTTINFYLIAKGPEGNVTDMFLLLLSLSPNLP